MKKLEVTVVVCSNKPDQLLQHTTLNIRAARETAEFLIVLDLAPDKRNRSVANLLTAEGARCIFNTGLKGLSTSRNLALQHCVTPFILYIDDDVLISKATLKSILQGFRDGYDIVGSRIDGPSAGLPRKWYLNKGQLHYLAIHNFPVTQSTWGACMGLRLDFLNRYSLRFRAELGRTGNKLQSGDDTTLLDEMRHAGAREVFQTAVSVVHNIPKDRLTFTYLIRRAFWQGRSEVRRDNILKGFIKECRRHFYSVYSLQSLAAAIVFIGVVAAGIVTEIITRFILTIIRRASVERDECVVRPL